MGGDTENEKKEGDIENEKEGDTGTEKKEGDTENEKKEGDTENEKKEGDTENEKKGDEENKKKTDIPAIEEKKKYLDPRCTLFEGLVFLLNRETPQESLEFIVTSMGGTAIWQQAT